MSETESPRPVLPSGPLPTDTKCPICLEDIVNLTYANQCLHFFCFECIDEWIREHNKCPLCRRRIQFLCHNLRGPSDYDTRAVMPPLVQRDLVVPIGSNFTLVITPEGSGLYLIYPQRMRAGIYFAVHFLAQGQNYMMRNVDPGTLYVLPEDIDAVLARLRDLGLRQYVGDSQDSQNISPGGKRQRRPTLPF